MSGGEHSTDVICQRQQRAHRNVRLTTRSGRRQIIGCRYQSRRRPRYSTFPAIRQPDDNHPRSPPRAPVADRKALAIQGMVRISHPYLSDSPVKRCGIPKCSATQLSPTLSWTASSTTPIASSCVVSCSAERRLRSTPVTHIAYRWRDQPSPRATPLRPTSIGTAGRLQSEWVADIRPESPAEFVGMRRCCHGRQPGVTEQNLGRCGCRCQTRGGREAVAPGVHSDRPALLGVAHRPAAGFQHGPQH